MNPKNQILPDKYLESLHSNNTNGQMPLAEDTIGNMMNFILSKNQKEIDLFCEVTQSHYLDHTNTFITLSGKNPPKRKKHLQNMKLNYSRTTNSNLLFQFKHIYNSLTCSGNITAALSIFLKEYERAFKNFKPHSKDPTMGQLFNSQYNTFNNQEFLSITNECFVYDQNYRIRYNFQEKHLEELEQTRMIGNFKLVTRDVMEMKQKIIKKVDLQDVFSYSLIHEKSILPIINISSYKFFANYFLEESFSKKYYKIKKLQPKSSNLVPIQFVISKILTETLTSSSKFFMYQTELLFGSGNPSHIGTLNKFYSKSFPYMVLLHNILSPINIWLKIKKYFAEYFVNNQYQNLNKVFALIIQFLKHKQEFKFKKLTFKDKKKLKFRYFLDLDEHLEELGACKKLKGSKLIKKTKIIESQRELYSTFENLMTQYDNDTNQRLICPMLFFKQLKTHVFYSALHRANGVYREQFVELMNQFIDIVMIKDYVIETNKSSSNYEDNEIDDEEIALGRLPPSRFSFKHEDNYFTYQEICEHRFTFLKNFHSRKLITKILSLEVRDCYSNISTHFRNKFDLMKLIINSTFVFSNF